MKTLRHNLLKSHFPRWISVLCLAGFFAVLQPGSVWAGREMDVAGNSSLVLRGLTKTIGAAFQIPVAMLQDSGQVMFPLGIVTGAVRGSMKTVVGLVSGSMDIVSGAGPYAKYAFM